jgi:hypothetical protein
MPFPDTIETLLIILFAVLPGYVGESVYTRVAGVNWRESPWRAVLRVLVISVAGVYLYALLAAALNALGPFDLPLPTYAFPAVLSDPRALAVHGVVRTGGALLGHVTGSVVTALVAPRVMRALPHARGWPSAWDEMVREYVRGRWVMVELKNGQFLVGKLEVADASVAASERDLVLEEPCQLDPVSKRFVPDTKQFLFLPADAVASVAALTDIERDTRITTPYQPLTFGIGQ